MNEAADSSSKKTDFSLALAARIGAASAFWRCARRAPAARRAKRRPDSTCCSLPGVPNILLENAEKKLDILETEGERTSVTDSFLSEHASSHNSEHQKEEQLSFFGSEINPAVKKLKKLDLMEVKPLEAIRILKK